MKAGIDLVSMAQTLEANRKVARDFVADTRKIEMKDDGKTIALEGAGEFQLQRQAETQLAEKLKVPAVFYQRLRDNHPDLLAHTVNTLFKREPGQHMVRTLPGAARAVLSRGFRPLDNYDLFDAIYPALREAGALVESCNLSDTLMHIKVRCPWLDRELPVPEGLKMGVGHNWFVRRVQGAVSFRNSEVGMGGLSILPGIFEKQCTNLAVFKDDGLVKVHIGRRTDATDSVREYLTDETKRLDDAAFWATVRDTAKAMMSGQVFEKLIGRMQEARGDAIVGNPAKVVEVFAKENQLTEKEQGGLLRHLVDSGEMNRYGLQWAVTRLSQDVEDYDRASDMERLGGRVIELPSSQWEVLAKAA